MFMLEVKNKLLTISLCIFLYKYVSMSFLNIVNIFLRISTKLSSDSFECSINSLFLIHTTFTLPKEIDCRNDKKHNTKFGFDVLYFSSNNDFFICLIEDYLLILKMPKNSVV